MKKGDYVRTKYGIAKCIKATPIRENSFLYEFDREVYEDVFHLTASELEKYKSSPNIIDLIEIGDYVNGSRVYSGVSIDTDDYGNDFKEVYVESDKYIYHSIREENIKSIVTKEQFGSLEYKVVE